MTAKVITRPVYPLSPDKFTISWTRAYSTPLRPQDFFGPAGLQLEKARAAVGPQVASVADGDPKFYDVQTLRERHVARARFGGVALCPWWAGSHDATGDVEVRTHLVSHATRFLLLRLTLVDNSFSSWRPSTDEDFREFNRAVWDQAVLPWRITLPGGEVQLVCGVREVMDLLYFYTHEVVCGRPPNIANIVAVVKGGWHERYHYLQRLADTGEIATPYPVVFGTHYEFHWQSGTKAVEQRGAACALARGVDEDGKRDVAAVPAPGDSGEWLLGENQSVLVTANGRLDEEMDAYDPLRLQIVEYLNLQRGALRTVQRQTQLVITEARPVTRKQVAGWTRLVGALTDDYVLHDRVAAVLEPLKRHLTAEAELRDPLELERQVRRNLETFSAALDAATDRAGVILSLLFGIVAAVSLADPARRAFHLAFGLSGPVDEFESKHAVLSLSIDAALIVLISIFSALVYRRVRRPQGW